MSRLGKLRNCLTVVRIELANFSLLVAIQFLDQFFSLSCTDTLRNQTPEFNTMTGKRCRFLFKSDTSLVKIMNGGTAESCTKSLKILYKLDQVEDPSRILFKILCREWW